MRVLFANLLLVLLVALFSKTAPADVPARPNQPQREGVSMGIYDVKKELTPMGWLVVVSGLTVTGYGLLRLVRGRRIK